MRATSFTLRVSSAGPLSAATVVSSPLGISSTGTWLAVFAESTTVTLTEAPGSTMAFAGWGDTDGCPTNFTTCAVVMEGGDKEVSVQFNPLLALSMSGNGLGSVSDSSDTITCSGSTGGCANGVGSVTQAYSPGTVVVLTATPANSSSTFTGWTGAGCSGVSTCTVTMNGYKAVVSTFSSSGPFVLKISLGGTKRGKVTSSPAGISCGPLSAGTCSASFAANTSVAFSTEASAGHAFVGWANGGCTGSTTACVVLTTSAYQSLGGARSPAATFY